jgi:DedD protein
MAKPVSEEELQLKKRARRRLIGAIALVAAVAAVLPMVLDSEPKPTSQEINIQIPSPDAKGGFTSKVAPVPVPGRPADKAALAAKAAATATEAPPAMPEPAPEAQKETPAPAPKPKPALEKAAAKPPEKTPEKAPEKVEKSAAIKPGPGTFFIQVIALSEVDKAKQVQQQINEAGIRSYTEVVAAGTGKVTRVRAGPFATRDEAERARTKLQGIGLEGKVAAN